MAHGNGITFVPKRFYIKTCNVIGKRSGIFFPNPRSILFTIFQRVKMPPIRNKKKRDLAEQEGWILLAISDLQNGQILRVAQAARIYNIT